MNAPGTAAPPDVRRAAPAATSRDVAGFAEALHAEWTKLRTVRGTVIGLVGVTLATILLSLLAAQGGNALTCTGPAPQVCVGLPDSPVGPDGTPVVARYAFAHRSLTGDGSLSARVSALTGYVAAAGSGTVVRPDGAAPAVVEADLRPWAKAGLVIAASTDPGASYGGVLQTAGHGVRLQWDYTQDVAGPQVDAEAPVWLRLTRHGDDLTAASSTDGVTWTNLGTAHLDGLPATVEAGLVVTSPVEATAQDPSTSASAVFSQVTTDGDWSASGWALTAVGEGSTYPTLGPPDLVQRGDELTVTGSGDLAPAAVGGLFGGETLGLALSGTLAGLLVAIAVGAAGVTAELRRGLIGTTFLAMPDRGRVLAAKALVLAGSVLVAGLVAGAVAVPVCFAIAREHGLPITPFGVGLSIRAVLGTAVLLAATAVLAMATSVIVRRGVAAVGAVAALVVLPAMLGTAGLLPAGAAAWLMRLTPAAGLAVQQHLPRYPQVDADWSVANGYFPLPPWAGLAVTLLWVIAALGLAFRLVSRRDA